MSLLFLVKEVLVCWLNDPFLTLILRDAADANDNASLLEQAGAGTLTAQPPAAANAAVALTQMHNWDSDFVSIHRVTTSITAGTVLIHTPGRVPRLGL